MPVFAFSMILEADVPAVSGVFSVVYSQFVLDLFPVHKTFDQNSLIDQITFEGDKPASIK